MEKLAWRVADTVARLVTHLKVVPVQVLRAERLARNADIRRLNAELKPLAKERNSYQTECYRSAVSLNTAYARLSDQSEELRAAERERNEAVERARALTSAAELARLREAEVQLQREVNHYRGEHRRLVLSIAHLDEVSFVDKGDLLVIHTDDIEAASVAAEVLAEELRVPIIALPLDEGIESLDASEAVELLTGLLATLQDGECTEEASGDE